jgi:ribonuclease HI
MINCALSSTTIEKLYKSIYKHMSDSIKEDGTTFSPVDYMAYIYGNKAQASTPETAAKLVQHIPRMIIDLYNTDFIQDTRFPQLDLNALANLGRLYSDPATGVNEVINTYKETSKKFLRAYSKTVQNEAGDTIEEDPEGAFYYAPERFMPYTALTGTSQELIAVDPTRVDMFVETLDESKRTIYNTLNKIETETGGIDSAADNLVYQGKTLKLKAVKLTSIPQDELDDYTRNLIIRSKSIKKTAQTAQGVTPADEQVLLVLSDEDNNFIYFSENGDISAKTEGGKLVYQFLRDAKKQGDKYSVSTIYGYKSVLSPAEIALSLYKTNDPAVIASVEAEQQNEFAMLYNIKERVLNNNEELLLPVSAISQGVLEGLVGRTVLLSDLASKADIDKEVFKSIKTVQKDRAGFKKGYSTITINGTEVSIDRPDATEDIARQVSKVLTDRNLPFKVRTDFYFQFFNNKIDYRARKHSTSIEIPNQEFYFNYSNQTFQENPTRKFLDNTIDLSQIAIESLSDEQLAAYEKKIFDVLMSGKGRKDKMYPSKMTFNSELLKNERYFVYNTDTKQLGFGNYIDFLKTLPAAINLRDINKDVVNSYIIFAAPNKMNSIIDKAKATVAKDNRTPTKILKDEIVDVVKAAGIVDATVSAPKSGFYMGKFYANYQVSVPGIEATAKAYYPNKTLIITKGDKNYKDTNFPVEGETVRLQVRDELVADGVVYKDVVEIFKVNPDNTIGEYIGVIAEKDVSEYTQPAVPEELDELEIEVPSDEEQAPVSPVIEDIEQNEGPVTPHNEETNTSNLLKKNWKGLDRAGILPNDATEAQIDEATKWWNSENNPLKNKIGLDTAANLVNSNVWARFVVAGQTLLSGDTLGEIQINKGTMVDVYHEAWHAFSQLYLTKDQKRKLYDEVRNYTKNGKKPYENMSYRDIEEMLAEDFRSFAKNPKQAMKDTPVKKSIFQKILDFLKALFGKAAVVDKSVVANQDYPVIVSELYDKLYFAGSSEKASKAFMNNYTPLIDNVMWNMLDRGVERVDARGDDALNRQDSILINESIDSIISEMVDDLNEGFGRKSSTIKLLTDPENRAVAYESVKEVLQDRLNQFKEELGDIAQVPFNSINTLEQLESNAVGVFKSRTGDNKYIYLANQIDNFDNLNPDTKGGDRVKGQSYFGIDIVADFYSHKTIKSDKDATGIIVVKDIKDAERQFDNYIKGGAKDFTAFELKQGPQFKPLTFEQEELLDKIRILQIAIDNWGDDKKGVIKYHKENSRFDIIREDYTEEVFEERDQDGEPVDETSPEGSPEALVKDGSVGKKSLEQLAQKEALYLIRSLFKIQKGKTVPNKLGFSQLADFSKIWKIVTREIGGVKDINTMYDKLRNAAETYSPELKQLVYKKLPNPNDIKRTPEFDVLASIWQTFSRPRVSYMQLTGYLDKSYDERGNLEITGVSVEVTDASIDASNITRKFQAEFKAQTERDNPYISKVENVTTLNNLSKLVSDFADKRRPNELDVNKSFEFARAIGFMFDDLPIIKQRLKDNVDYYGLQYIYTIVKDFANIQSKGATAPTESTKVLGDFVVNPLVVLQSKISGKILPGLKVKEVYQKNIVKRLAELQMRYGLEGSNFSVLNPEKNLVSEFIDDHSISRQVDAINRVNNIKELYSNSTAAENPFKFMSYLNPATNSFVNNNRSQILNSIFATEGNGDRIKGRTLKLFIDSGTQIANEDIGTTTTSLDIYSKFLQEMHMMLKGGVQEFIRHASKKSSFGVKVDGGVVSHPGKGDDKNLYVDMSMFVPNGGGDIYSVNNILIPYLGAEYERVMKFKSNKDEFLKYSGYNKVVARGENGEKIYAGEVLTIFDNVLTEETKQELMSEEVMNTIKEQGITLEDFLRTDKSGLKMKVTNDIINYFNQQTSENLSFLGVMSYIDKSLVDKLNSPGLSEQEQREAIVKAYTYNSWIHNFETVNLFYLDPAQRNHLKEDEHKRNTGSTSGGPKFLTDQVAQDFINNIWNKDRVDENGKVVERATYASKIAAETKNPEYNKFHYDGTFNTAVIKDIERTSEYIKDIEKALREDYKANGKSDAQINDLLAKELKPYKEMNEADGAGYITIDAYRTLKKLENAWSNKQEELYKKIINKVPIKASDVVNFFPVYKLQHYGPLANAQLPLLAFHKFALMPLIPSEINNSQLEHLHKEMLRNNVQYVTYESGSKVGAITSSGKPDDVYADSDQKELKKEITFTPNTIYLEYLKNVTNVNAKFKTIVTFPTQLRGLILDGLYNQGKITKNEYEKLGDKYDSVVAQYTDLLKLEMLNEIGYEEKNGRYIGNIKNFLELIQKELGKRDIPDHLLRSIGVDSKGNIKTDLSLHLEADAIERMLLSLLTKRLIRQKVKGEALVQVPSSMYNGLWDQTVQFDKASEADRKKYLGSNTLPSYHPGKDGTNAMKIAIALQGDFVNLLNLEYNGKPIGDIYTLNQAIKDDNWLNTGNNRKAITLAGARIPIQNLNSMEFAEVWHFLDPAAGNKVVVPTEIVAKAGSDFDVDKIFWMMPHINTRGEYATGAISNEELKQKIADLEKVKPKPGMKKPSAKALIEKQKKALENELIQATKDILATPANYASLVRPNETHLVKGTADEFEPYVIEYNRYKNMHGEEQRMGPADDSGKRKKAISPTRILEVGYNLHKHDVNMVGKDTLGIEALQNKKHPIFKSIGAKMPKTYKESFFDENSGKYVDGTRDYKTRLLLPHAEIDGHISLSDNTNVSGTRIADVYSHIMNGLLDVEKDPWAFYIQANLETIGILNYLLEAGVPEKTAIAFVSQPMVRDYTTNQKIFKSTFYTLAEKKTLPFSYVKYQAANKVEKLFPYAMRNKILTKINNDAFEKAISGLTDNTPIMAILAGETAQETTVGNLKRAFANNIKKPSDVVMVYTGDFSELYDLEFGGKKVGDREGLNRALKSSTWNNINVNAINKVRKQIYKKASSLITNATTYDAAVLASQEPGVLNDKGFFDEEMLVASVKDPKNPKYKTMQIAAFLHFLEIEKQIKGLEAVKRQSNPDTKLLKTIQQVRKREQAFLDSTETSKVDPSLPEGIRNKSILRSFYQGELALDLVEPVMPLRLNKEVANFITNKLASNRTKIASKFGQGIDGEERFTSEFNNAVINYIFQNYMSNFVDSKGNLSELPDVYRGSQIVIKPGVPNGVEYKDGVIYIDRSKLTKDYTEKKYLRTSNVADSYAKRGLATFSESDNPFPTQASFNRFVVEREYLRSIYTGGENYTAGYEKFLTQRALINTFNRDAIVGTDEYSYTNLLMNTINEFSQLKDRYPIMAQLSVLPYKGKEKIVQLNDRNILKGELGDVYYQNIRELADPNVRKVSNEADNKRLSDVFRVFSLMMIHQHGVGYSKYGFNKALDDTMYLEIMRSAAGNFMQNNLNEASLSKVYDRFMSDTQFKNYVVDPTNFNSNKVFAFPLTETTAAKNIIDNLVNTIGEDQFNQMVKEANPDLTIIDVPENLDLSKLYSEEYDDYVDITYETLNTMLDRLATNGVNIDTFANLFHNFTTDSPMDIVGFSQWLDENIKAPTDVVEPQETEVQLSLFEEEKKESQENKTSLLSTLEKPLLIYSDGSDIKGTGKIGFGAVYKLQDKEFGLSGTEEGDAVQDLASKFPNAKFSNPTMEMLALASVLETFQDTGEHLYIHQDYNGAVNYNGLWQRSEGSLQRADKPWKSKEPYIQYLIDKAVKAIDKIEANGGSVKITWVKGHSGEMMNDLADKYAKSRKNFNEFLKPLSNQLTQPVELKGKMSFAYGDNRRPGVTADTTIQAVALGERTATTRYEGQQGFEYWKKAKTGDIIQWVSDNGDSLKVKVTKPLHKLIGSGKTANQWSQLEGWSTEYFNNVVRPKLDKAWQIEFEYIPDTYKNAINTAQEAGLDLDSITSVGNYTALENFYNTLTEDQQKKLGSFDDMLESYYEMHADTMSEEQYIEYLKNCKL